MRVVGLFLLACCLSASATTYYVSNTGTDAPGCTSAATACRTLGYVNGSIAVQAGDSVLLQRGGVWNEQLVPPISGSSGNPITYDAYGTGAAPVITAAAAINGGFIASSWYHVSGNVWATNLTPGVITGMAAATTVDALQFGAVWGRKQPYGTGCANSVASKYDYCLVYPKVYVYAPAATNPVTYYAAEGSITPYVDSTAGLPLIPVAGRSYLVFQHIKLVGFSYMGVSVTGASDNLTFANMESDGMLPYGTTPHGFYVNASSGHGTNVQFLNDDADLNYDGFHIEAATSVTVTNCQGYANRDAGLRDNNATGPVATYSYSHFYGNNVAQFLAGDVIGGIAGSGNVGLVCGAPAGLPAGMCSSMVAPEVTNFAMYPARFSFTVDDVGSSSGTEDYINSLLSRFSSRGLNFNAAVVPSYSVDWNSVRAWHASGNEVDSHSWSHQYYTENLSPSGTCTLATCPNARALKIQYVGSGSSAAMTVSGTTLTVSVPGTSDGFSINLANAPYDQMGYTGTGGWGLANYLNTRPNFNITIDKDPGTVYARPNTHTVTLAGTSGSSISISGQDIKSAPFAWTYDQALLLSDEMNQAKAAIQSNVPGLVETFLVYPDGIEDVSAEAAAVAAGYTAARGSLAMKGQDNGTGSANSLYSNGVNVQNITSLGAIAIHGMTQGQVKQITASLVFRAAAWGAPYGLFTHYNSWADNTPDISNTELEWLLDGITASGGVWLTNTALANAVKAGTAIGGTTRYVQNPNGSAVNLSAAQANSPTVGRGMATTYPVDLNGVDRSKLGAWDIGASAYLSQRYGTAGAGSTRIGGWATEQSVAVPQVWVNSKEWAGTTTNAISFPASGSDGSWSCGATSYGPYTAGLQASLQQAINDAEACRTANGSGTQITIPAGAVFSGSQGVTLPQTAGDSSTNFIVLQSSSPLPTGRTVCSHGIQDNVPESTQPGIRNLGCNGMALSYQLGTTITPVSGSFTLANGTNTSASAYNDVALMYTIECTGSNCNAVQTASADANNVGPHHYAIVNAELRPVAGSSATLAPVAIGQGNETIISQIPKHIHLAYDYLHGDWTDAPVSGGVATAGPTGANSLPNNVALNGCIYCSISYSYTDRSIRPGAEGHAVALKFVQQIKIVHNWFEGQSIGHLCGGWASAISIPNFVACLDMEDRANRYTYPYSWMLAWDAGYCVNNVACSGHAYVRKNAHEYKFSQRVLLDGNIFENVDNSGSQNGTTMSFKTAQNSAGAMGDNYWTIQTDSTITNNILRNSCNGPNLGAGDGTSDSSGGGVSLPAWKYLYSNNLMYNVSTTNVPGCSNATPHYGFRVNSRASSTWTATAQRGAAGLTTTLTLTGVPGGMQSMYQVGDPVVVYGCADASFNTSTGQQTTMGPPALAGTQTTGLTVVYANPGTPNATTTGCTLYNSQGWTQYVTYNHNSDFVDTGAASPSFTAHGGTNPWDLARNLSFTNSITVGGYPYSTYGEGARTQTKAFDTSTLIFHHLVFAGRDTEVACPGHNAGAGGIAACYNEYSDSSALVSPAVTVWGTPNGHCAGNDPTTENCVGVLGAMSQGAFPAVLANWHQYRLCHPGDAACNGKASVYAAGGVYDASDGRDLGADLNQIEAAQVSGQYCKPNCGIGSYPD